MKGVSEMGRASKFTDEQKFEIAFGLPAGRLSHAEICRKWEISSTYAYKLKDRAVDILREGTGRPAERRCVGIGARLCAGYFETAR